MRPSACARSLTAALLASTALSPPAWGQALPTGANVAYGSVGFQRSSGTLTINQSSQNAIVNYNSFSIGQGKTVTFNQPNASSAILNRVVGSTPSTIAGSLNANGQVYLINPNGIAITKTGVVKVGGGFVASTLGMSDDEFKGARTRFKGTGASASVTNAGTISIGRGGYAALIGGTVTNSGLISVPMGKVGLGSGEAATLDVSGDGFLQVAVPTVSGGNDALIQQSGTISAAGGTVVIDAATARAAARNAVNISGGIDAHSIAGHNGAILIGGGDGGRVEVSGHLNVASRRGAGGAVTVTGQTIALKGARIDASGKTGGGTVRIGGDLHGSGMLAHAGTVTIDAKSAIRADATGAGKGGSVVVWSDETTSFAGLISAKGGARGGDGGNVEVSSHGVLSDTGLATLTAAKGAAGTLLLDPYNVVITNGSDSNTSFSGGTYTPSGTSVISNTELDRQLANGNVTITTAGAGMDAGNITVAAPITWSTGSLLTLTADNAIAINAGISITGGGKLALNAATTAVGDTSQPLLSFGTGGNVTYASGQSGQALSINGTSYTLEYSLASLASDANAAQGAYALATNLDGSNGGNGYTSAPITTTYANANGIFYGTLEGLGHTVSNLTIAGGSSVGLVGVLGSDSTIRDIGIVGGTVSGTTNVGALVGQNQGVIVNAYASTAVSGVLSVGGLVGVNNQGSIIQSYATGNVTSSMPGNMSEGAIGGLVGSNGYNGVITLSYATGSVTADSNGYVVGGLVGGNSSHGTITQSYATGAVAGSYEIGGLVGDNSGQISNVYATGTVTDSQGQSGGLVGQNEASGSIIQAYATGALLGSQFGGEGGLVGYNYGSITQAYATGAVTSTGPSVAGLVGINGNGGTITQTYATGVVIDNSYQIGGLVGNDGGGGVTYSAYDSSTTGAARAIVADPKGDAANVAVLTTAQLQSTATANPFGSASGFTGGPAGGQNGLYPYLASFFPNGVQAISGFAYKDGGATAAAGATVGLIANGATFANPSVGANGFFYAFAPAGTAGNGTSNLLAYGATTNSATVANVAGTPVSGGNSTLQTGLTLYGDTLSGTVSDTLLSTATASLVNAASRAANGNAGALAAISAATGRDYIATGSSFTIDQTVSINSLFGVQTTTANAPITVATGDSITIGNGGALILDAAGALTVNAPITAKGAVSVALAYDGNTTTPLPTDLSFGLTAIGFTSSLTYESASGGSLAGMTGAGGTLSVNGTPYTLVYTMAEFDAIDGTSATGGANPATYGPGLAGSYALAANLDASGTTYTDALIAQGQNGYNPGFSGTFEGLGHVISGLTINQATTGSEPKFSNLTGLFGQVNSGGAVRDLGLTGGSVLGVEVVGDLVGLNSGALTQVYATGAVSGFSSVGDLVGSNYQGSITNAYATGGVTETSIPSYDGGGLGGLVGQSYGGTITNAYAAGSVVGTATSGGIGGLVGGTYNDMITNAYATGAVSGGTNSRALGGLIGSEGGTLTITNVYATSAVSGGAGSTDLGGLIGGSYGSATISNAYYDNQTAGQSDTNVAGLPTRQLQGLDPLADGATFSVLTNLGNGTTSAFAGGANGLYPYLVSFYPNGVQAVSGTVYDGNVQPLASGANGAVTVTVAGANATLGTAATGANGYYYVFGQPGTIDSNANVVAYTTTNATTNTTKAAGIAAATNTPAQSGVDIYESVPLTYAATSQTTYSSYVGSLNGGTPPMAPTVPTGSAIPAFVNGATPVVAATGSTGFTFDVPATISNTLNIATAVSGAPITIAQPLTVANGGTLGLYAAGALAVDANVTVPGTGAVTLAYDQSTATPSPADLAFAIGSSLTYGTPGSGSLAINGQAYTLLYSIGALQNISGQSSAYALVADLDGTNGGAGYSSALAATFSGTLEGLGHTVSNLTIMSDSYAGLIGQLSGGSVRDIGLVGGSVTGASAVGDLVGLQLGGTLANVYATGTVIAGESASAGGLVGISQGTSTIINAFATGAVTAGAGSSAGGLVGSLQYGGTITDAYATGAVSAGDNGLAGGLVGNLPFGAINNAYATGSVTASGQRAGVGGLVGLASQSSVTNGLADGQTSGQGGPTTAQLQDGSTAAGLGAAFALTPGLYPYLKSFYPTTPQAVSGIAYSDRGVTPDASGANGAQVVTLDIGGAQTAVTTGANGYYYALQPAGSIAASGTATLAYTTADNTPGGTVSGAALTTLTGTASHLDVWANTLIAPTAATALSTAPTTGAALYGSNNNATLAMSAQGSNAANALGDLAYAGYIATGGVGFTVDAAVGSGGTGGLYVQTTQGPINVTAAQTFTAPTNLTLLSANALTFQAPVTVQGGTVNLAYDQSTMTPSATDFAFGQGDALTFSGGALAINGQAYTLEYSLASLTSDVAAAPNQGGSYALATNVDGSNGGTGYTVAVVPNLNGTLEGLGHVVTNLTIDDTYQYDNVGLIGTLGGTGAVRDIGLVGGSVTGVSSVGALVGYNFGGPITLDYATTVVSGTGNSVGGLVGSNSGALTQVYSTGAVTASGGSSSYYIGGLAGYDGGAITQAYATGAVSGGLYVGGLVGVSTAAITQAYATGAVSGPPGAAAVGGLVGGSIGGTVTQSYWDTQTSGLSTSAGGSGATGLTTAQLQDGVAVLGSAFAGGTGGLYPYLSSFFPKGVQVISGSAYTDAGLTPAAGATVGVIAGGQSFDTVSAGANGYFYAVAPSGTVPNDTNGATTLLAYSTTPNSASLTNVNGAAVAGAGASTLQSGVTLYGNAVTVPTNATSLSAIGANKDFASAQRAAQAAALAADGDVMAATSAINGAQGLGLIVSSAFAVDAPVTTSGTFLVQTPTGSTLNVTSPITIASGGALGLLSGGPLAVDAPVTVKGTVSVNLAYDASNAAKLAFAQGAPLTYTDASGNPLAAAPAAGAGSLTVNKQAYTLLYSLADVAGIDSNYTAGGDSGNYALVTNLMGSGTAAAPQFTSSLIASGDSFGGTFEGLGHTITNLTIASNERYVGLVSNNNGLVRDIGLVGGSVSGVATGDTPVYVGALAGLNTGTIAQAYATTTVSAMANAGNNFNIAIAGGLVGYNSGGAITNAYTTGPVSASAGGSGATAIAGGLVGYNDAYFTGGQGTIINSYAAGAVYASAPFNASSGSVAFAGGLVGTLDGSSGAVTITNAYATGAVSASDANTAGTGGLVGDNINGGFVTAGYYDTNTTGQFGDSAGATDLTTAQLQMQGGGANLGTAFGGGANGLYPYLNSFFPNGVQAISGTAYFNGGVTRAASYGSDPITVSLIANGASFGSATTGANGYYYAFAPAGTATTGSLLAYSTTTKSATLTSIGAPEVIYSAGGTVQTGVNLYGNAVTVPTGETSLQSYIMNGGSVTSAQTLAEAADDAAHDAQSTIQAATGLGLAVHNAFTIDAPLPTPTNSTFVVQTDASQPLTVAAPITIANGGSLGLFSGGALNVNAPITAEGTASVALGFDASKPTNLAFAQGDALTYTDASGNALAAAPGLGLGGQLFINGQFYSLVYNMGDVANITNGLDGQYALAGSLYATSDGTATGTPTNYTSALIASANTPFSGTLEGLGHTITNLTIVDTTDSNVGLIASNSGTVRDIGLVGGSVIGQSTVGDLVGYNDGGAIAQTYATGAVGGQYNVGGLVGYNDNGGSITRAYATGAVSGSSTLGVVGGLVGYNDSGSTITQAYATGAVSGSFRVGGLVGANYSGIAQAYATGAVGDGHSEIGGLVGYNDGTVTASAYDKTTTGQTYGIGYNENGGQPGNSGATPLTTAQLQDGSSAAGLGSAFTVASGLYPYHTSFFPNGVQAVSGIAYSDNGQTPLASPATSNGLSATQDPGLVSVAAGGANLGSVTTGANGYYYVALPTGTLSSGTSVIAYTQADPKSSATPNGSGAQNAATYVTVGGVANQAAVNVYGGWQFDQAASTITTLSALNSADAVAASASTPTNLANREVVIGASAFLLDTATSLAGTLVLSDTGSVTQTSTGTITAAALGLQGTGGQYTLTTAGNTVPILATNTGRVAVQSASALTVGAVGDAVGTTVTGVDASATMGTPVSIVASGGALTLADGVTSGGAALLVANGAFTNNAGSGAVSTASGFTIYTQNTAHPTTALPTNRFGGLTGTNYYNDAYAFSSGTFATAIPSGNHFVYAYAASLTPVLSGSATKVYDGTSVAPIGSLSLSSTVFTNANGVADSATFSIAGATYDTPHAATGKTVTVTGIGLVSNPNNYTLSSTSASSTVGTVTPAPLTITADNKTKLYGAVLPTLTASYGGFVHGDSVTSLTVAPTLQTTATSASHVGSNPYTITASGAVDGDYTISYAAGQLTVTPAALTITADNQTKVYGAALPTLTASYKGLVNADTAASFTIAPTLQTTATAASHVGSSPYAITASGAIDSDYTIGYAAGQLTVTPLPVQLTGSRVYNATTGVAGSALAVTNLVNGDSVTVGGAGTLAAKDVGNEALTALGGLTLSSTDYTLVGGTGSVNVSPASLTYAANMASRTYGAANPMLSGTVTGFVGSDTLSTATTGTATFATGAIGTSNVGSYAIAGSGLAATDYVFAQAAGNSAALAVTPVPLTVSGTKVYDANTTFAPAQLAVMGAVNGEALTLTGGSGTPASANAGLYAGSALLNLSLAVTGGNGLASNYALPASGTLSITPAPITVAAASGSGIYGNVPVDPGLSAVGLQGGQGVGVLTGLSSPFALNQKSDAGTYALSVQGTLTNGNYRVVGTQSGRFVIDPRSLVVTADNQTRIVSTANAPLTYAVGGLGLVNGDTLTGSLATTAAQSSAVGVYSITQGTLAISKNYALTFNPGTLNVKASSASSAAGLGSTVDRSVTLVLGELPDGASVPLVISDDQGLLSSEIVQALSNPRFDAIVICSRNVCTSIASQKRIRTTSREH